LIEAHASYSKTTGQRVVVGSKWVTSKLSVVETNQKLLTFIGAKNQKTLSESIT
jgi:hypothetical protein